MDRTQTELRKFAAALQFFQRLPLPRILADRVGSDAGLADSAHWFPVAGASIALLPVLILALTAQFMPASVAAALAIVTGIWLTGALHEDGFADCADGLGSGADKDRALEIMRDSAVGTFGACALIVSIGLRWLALSLIADATITGAACALLASHAVSRGAIASALAFSSYARPQGTASVVAKGIGLPQWAVTMAVSVLLAILFAGWAGVAAAIAALVVAAVFLGRFETRIGGYTGDALGGMQQVAEITCLVALCGLVI